MEEAMTKNYVQTIERNRKRNKRMIPLLGLMLSIYFGFKGVEIFQIALAVPSENRNPSSMVIGVLALLAGLGLAGIFTLIWLTQGVNVPTTGLNP
jgi:uncharacterized membrane protein (DUF485 family)